MKASRAFTIFELLVVIAIMAILGAVAIANYRAIERGVAERAAMRSMNQFIRAAYHRAQIDKVPVAVFYWNETIQSESSFAPLTVVGKAVAVRRAGRFTKVDGDMLCDEFNDLQFDVLFGQNVLDLVQDLCVRGGRGTDFDGDLICGEAGGNSGEHYAKQHKNN